MFCDGDFSLFIFLDLLRKTNELPFKVVLAYQVAKTHLFRFFLTIPLFLFTTKQNLSAVAKEIMPMPNISGHP
jgi:hypothetical protein